MRTLSTQNQREREQRSAALLILVNEDRSDKVGSDNKEEKEMMKTTNALKAVAERADRTASEKYEDLDGNDKTKIEWPNASKIAR